MSRADLLEKLDKATSKAVTTVIGRGIPLSVTKKSTLVGNLFIQKNQKGFYNVLTIDRRILFEDIALFDIAVILAQRHSSGDAAIVRKVLVLEEQYSKHQTDMLHYLNCLKSAKKNHDLERMAILEDKFQVSESLAKKIRDSISFFKRVK